MRKTSFEWLKDFMVYLTFLYWSGFFMWHFIMIRFRGVIAVAEPNPFMLWFEIIVTALFFCLAMERLMKHVAFRKLKKPGNASVNAPKIERLLIVKDSRYYNSLDISRWLPMLPRQFVAKPRGL